MQSQIEAVFGAGKRGHGYIRIRCPYHTSAKTGGKERNPSMSILTQDKNGFEAGFCKCFTCGWTGSITRLFKDAGYTFKQPAKQKVSVAIQLTTQQPKTKQNLRYTFSPYLAQRRISAITQSLFRTYEQGGKVHMPVFNRQGTYLYRISRSTEGKMYFIEENSQKTLACIEEIDFSEPVYIVESQINAYSLFELGLQAVATLGAASTSILKEALAQAQHIILAFDPDEAGILATERCLTMFGPHRSCYLELPAGKDINDILCDMLDYGCSKTEVVDYLKSCQRYIYLGRLEE